MPKVRTTIEPDRDIEVSEEERTDLQRFGLLVDNKAKARKADAETKEN